MALIFIVYLVVINLVTYLVYAIDKSKARHHEWRIPESVLLWLAILGGSIGALTAMKRLRHKTHHIQFYMGIPAILMLQLVAAFFYLYSCID